MDQALLAVTVTPELGHDRHYHLRASLDDRFEHLVYVLDTKGAGEYMYRP
jgi:hypothetical protein